MGVLEGSRGFSGVPSRTFRIGLNPYGLSFSVGLQGDNPASIGLDGFIALVRELGVEVIELDHRWITPLGNEDLARLRERLAGLTTICSYWLSHTPGETLEQAVRCNTALGATIIRFHLTPVLEGARASWGPRWDEMIGHARATLARESSRVADAGLILAIEDHQDVGSEELVALAEELGPHVGITFDTGNPFAVGEDPVAFARRAAARIRHVHLKDYVAQFTTEGYRLVRCAIGEGCVPFADIADVLRTRGTPITASIEPGALESRHIRVFTSDWWRGYPPREGREVAVMLGRLQTRRLAADADPRTPWELRAAPEVLSAFELDQVRRSVANVRRSFH